MSASPENMDNEEHYLYWRTIRYQKGGELRHSWAGLYRREMNLLFPPVRAAVELERAQRTTEKRYRYARESYQEYRKYIEEKKENEDAFG